MKPGQRYTHGWVPIAGTPTFGSKVGHDQFLSEFPDAKVDRRGSRWTVHSLGQRSERNSLARLLRLADVHGATVHMRAQVSERWLAEHGFTNDGTGWVRRPQDPKRLTEADEPHAGAMVALVPSREDAQRLAVEDGLPADELHVTLVYLGDGADFDDEDRAAIVKVVREVVQDTGPVEAEAFAVSVFNPSGDEPCIVLGVTGEAVAEVHDEVTEALSDVDYADQRQPWVAHLTLIYTDDLAEAKDFTDLTGPVTFDRVRIAFAGETTDIPLGGAVESVRTEAGAVVTSRRLTALDMLTLARVTERFDPDQLRAPKGTSIGGRWVARAAIAKLLGADMPEGGPDVRRSTGRFTTAGGSVVSVRLPSRRPRIDDRVRDPRTGKLGTVQTTHPDGKGRIGWDDGSVEVRDLTDLQQPGGVRDLPDPKRSFDLERAEPTPKAERTTPGPPRTAAEKMADMVASGNVPTDTRLEAMDRLRVAAGKPATPVGGLFEPGVHVPRQQRVQQVADEVRGLRSEADVMAHLDEAGLSRGELDALGKHLGVNVSGAGDERAKAARIAGHVTRGGLHPKDTKTLAEVERDAEIHAGPGGMALLRGELQIHPAMERMIRTGSHPLPGSMSTPVSRAPKGAAPPPAGEVRARLDSMPSEDAARSYIAGLGLDVAGLKTLAADLDVPLARRTKAGIVDDIVKVRVSGRLATQVLQRLPSLGGQAGSHSPAVRKMAAAKAPAFEPREVVDRLNAAGSETDIIGILSSDPKLTAAKLKQVAAELNIDVPPSMRAKSALQLHIAEKAAQARGLPGADPMGLRILARGGFRDDASSPAVAKMAKAAPPSAGNAREHLLSLNTDAERREYLSGLGLSQAQANRLAKDLGARQTRISPDATIDSIVGHFSDAPGTSPPRKTAAQKLAGPKAPKVASLMAQMTPEERSVARKYGLPEDHPLSRVVEQVSSARSEADIERILRALHPTDVNQVGKELGIKFPASMSAADRTTHIARSIIAYGM